MGSISSSLSSIFSPVSVEPGNSSASSSASDSTSGGSASSAAAGGSSSTSSSDFVGTSQYSAELASEVSREVQIAGMPIQLLTQQQSSLTAESNEMTTIGGLVGNLVSAVQGIQSAMDGSSFDASVTDASGNTSAAVQASLDDSAQEGVYSMTVNNIGSYAAGNTTGNWSPSSSSASYNLVLNGKSYAITTSDNSASGIANAINQEYGNVVQATVVNLSSTQTSIALQATSLGQQTLDLQNSSGQSLFSQNASGSQAEYTVTGGQPVFTNSRQVEISPGVTLTMDAPTTGAVNVTVSRSDSVLGDALSNFATAYNAVVDAVTSQHGQSAGPLQGNPILTTIANTLNQIGLYSSSSGSVSSLYNLGLELNANGNMNGHLTFNSFNLAAEDIQNSGDIDTFLGNSSSSGFLQTATNLLNDLSDPSTGLLTNAESNIQNQITDLGNTISTKQAQVSQLQTNLTNQMAQADALIAETEQQFNYMTEMFQAQQIEAMQYTQL